MIQNRVYLDNNATTPLHEEVQKAIIEFLPSFGNPSSMHTIGRTANSYIAGVRKSISQFINCQPNDIVFVGSGSEANNTVINAVTCTDRRCAPMLSGRDHIITTAIEHPCVLNTAEFHFHKGVPVDFLSVDQSGKINLDELDQKLTDKTALVSIMMANNEIGTIQDIKKIVEIAHQKGVLVHTDAVQAFGKIAIDVQDLDVDFLSFSAHKIYGPKGIGGLYIKKGTLFCPLIHGGHQEHGRRAGTENTIGIVGMGKAVDIARADYLEENGRQMKLRDHLKQGLLDQVPDIVINGHEADCLPNTLNVSFRGAEGESILLYLDMENIAISTGSACASGSLDPSHVLLATGVGAELAHGSVRFSLGRSNTQEDISYVLDKLPPIIEKIRAMSTVYGGRK